jgi:hypothetical protein
MFFEILDLPPIPLHLIQEIRLRLENDKQFLAKKSYQTLPGFEEYRNRKLLHPNGEIKSSVTADRYLPSDALTLWIATNVHSNPISININLTNVNSDTFGPHVDPGRRQIIIYVIDPGGDNVTTKWWQQIGYPVIRTDLQDITLKYNADVSDYTQLKECASLCIRPGQWVKFCDTAILHSVENLITPRLTVQIPIQ